MSCKLCSGCGSPGVGGLGGSACIKNVMGSADEGTAEPASVAMKLSRRGLRHGGGGGGGGGFRSSSSRLRSPKPTNGEDVANSFATSRGPNPPDSRGANAGVATSLVLVEQVDA